MINEKIILKFKEEKLSFSISDKLSIKNIQNHNDLKNLDYESSGHIGFASEKQLNLLSTNTVPRRLSANNNFTEVNLNNKVSLKNAFLYVDNNGKDSKLSLDKIITNKITTAEEIPKDMIVGDYVFLLKKEN